MLKATLCLSLLFAPSLLSGSGYDVVLQGGRVIDPETGLDGVRHVGVRGDRIVEISSEPLSGKDVVDVSGLVVAPGFIDLHAHGQTNRANEFQAHDGVTTALELELGAPFVDDWIASRRGNALINFGATVSHTGARWVAVGEHAEEILEARERVRGGDGDLADVFRAALPVRYQSLDGDELGVMKEVLREGMREGALGVGLALGYQPAATREEILVVHQLAAEMGVPVYTHVRSPEIAAIQESIALVASTGAPIHVVHVNSMALGRVEVALEMIRGAQENGLDITTELYPYTAASTLLESTLFDEGWQEVFDMGYGDLQWVATGERLTEETFGRYRAQGGIVIMHMMKEEWIEAALRDPITMIGSDGMPYALLAHPRSAGTFSRVLGRYVRERGALPLVDALEKMTLMPALRAETAAPSMRLKGRLQVGCDADITVFDPEAVEDTAEFGKELSFAEGIPHVMVNGTFVVRDGRTVEGVRPGRPVLGKYRR